MDMTFPLVLFLTMLMGTFFHELGHALVARSFGHKVKFKINLLGTRVVVEEMEEDSARRMILRSLYGFSTQLLFVLATVTLFYREEAWTLFSGLVRAPLSWERLVLFLTKLDFWVIPGISQPQVTLLIEHYGFDELARIGELIDQGYFESKAILAGLLANTLAAFWNLLPIPSLDGGHVVSALASSGVRILRRVRGTFRETKTRT